MFIPFSFENEIEMRLRDVNDGAIPDLFLYDVLH